VGIDPQSGSNSSESAGPPTTRGSPEPSLFTLSRSPSFAPKKAIKAILLPSGEKTGSSPSWAMSLLPVPSGLLIVKTRAPLCYG
jgi:hypothetical protein